MINLESIAIVVTGIIAIVKLNQSIKQNRNRDIVMFYEKSQEIRKELDGIRNYQKEKAKSLIKKLLNLYNILSYSILNTTIDEKDAFNLLKKNIFSVKNKFIIKQEDYGNYKSLIKLYHRWNKGGLSQYYFKKIFSYVFLILMMLLIIYSYII